MLWKPRFVAIGGTCLAAVLVVAMGTIVLEAQEVVDLPGEDRPVSGDFELVYRIGSVAAEAEWEQFSSIRDLGFDAAGNLYLMDGGGVESATRIVVVDPSGRYLHEFGRAGEGPGEFRSATQLVVWADGHTLVEDMLHQAHHVFDARGEFKRMVREAGADAGFGISRRPGLRPVRIGQHHTVIGRNGRSIISIDMSSEEVTERTLVEPWTPPGREDHGLRTGEIEELIDEEWGFEPDVVFDVLASGGVVFSDSSAYAIKVTDPSGDVSHVLRRPIRPMRVTEAMRSVERERRLEEQRNRRVTTMSGREPPPQVLEMFNRAQAGYAAAVENMQFFAEVPVVAAVRTSWSGVLWIERSTDPGTEAPGPIDVVAPHWEYVGTLPPGQPRMPDAFGPGGLVAFVETDEFDVPVVTVRQSPAAIRNFRSHSR